MSLRAAIFSPLGGTAKNVLINAKGLLICFSRDEVASLAQHLAAVPAFHHWIVDIVSPGLLRCCRKAWASKSGKATQSSSLRGRKVQCSSYLPGLDVVDVRSTLKTAARLKRLAFWMRLLSFLPDSHGKQGYRPWSGICLLRNQSAALRSLT